MFEAVKTKLRENEYLELNKKAIFTLGLWVSEERSNDWVSTFRQYVPITDIILSSFYGCIVFPIGALFKWGDITGMCECLFLEIIVLLAGSKGYSMFFYQKRFESLAQRIETMCKKWPILSQQEQSIRNDTQSITNLTVILIGLTLVVLALYLLIMTPAMLLFRTLIFGGWYPYDITVSPNFELTVLGFSFMSSQLVAVPMIDAYFISMVIQVNGQFKLLRHRLKHIREFAAKAVKARNGVASRSSGRLKHVEKSDASKRNKSMASDDYFSGGRSEGLFNVPIREHDEITVVVDINTVSQSGSQELEEIEQITPITEDVNIEMDRLLAECVKHHVELSEFVAEIESAFSLILIVQTGSAMIGLVLVVVWATLVTSYDFKAIGFLLIIIFGLSEFYCYCWIANHLSDQSFKVVEAVYDLDWFDATEGFKRSMKIVMSRSNRPIVINVAGLLPLSRETYKNVINSAFSCYNTLEASPY